MPHRRRATHTRAGSKYLSRTISEDKKGRACHAKTRAALRRFRRGELLDGVARERVGEDDDALRHVGHLYLVRAREHFAGLVAVERFVEIVVGVDDHALEFEPPEETFAVRVGEYPRVEREVRRGRCGAPDGASGRARLAAEFELVFEQAAQRVV